MLHILRIANMMGVSLHRSWLAEMGGSQLLPHQPVRLMSMTNPYSVVRSTGSRSTRCVEPAVSVLGRVFSGNWGDWRASDKVPGVRREKSRAEPMHNPKPWPRAGRRIIVLLYDSISRRPETHTSYGRNADFVQSV